jgi:hypothetical protein
MPKLRRVPVVPRDQAIQSLVEKLPAHAGEIERAFEESEHFPPSAWTFTRARSPT